MCLCFHSFVIATGKNWKQNPETPSAVCVRVCWSAATLRSAASRGVSLQAVCRLLDWQKWIFAIFSR